MKASGLFRRFAREQEALPIAVAALAPAGQEQ